MKDNKDIILLLLGIFVALGLGWEPIMNAKKNGTGIFDTTPSSSSYYIEDNNTTVNNPNQVTEQQISNQIKNTEATTKALQDKLAQEEAKKKQSPYYGKITLSSVAYLNSPDPSQEYITLYTNLQQNEKVDITGWKLQSDRSGNWVKIGGASTLPKPFVQNNKNVVLQQGDVAYIIKGFSPIGISFRSNKCTGYFGQDKRFYPSIRTSCPLPKDETLPKFSDVLDREDECLDMIDRIPACTVPLTGTNINKLPNTLTQSCINYMQNKINYDSCVENHYGDTDFPGREWYVYLNIFGPLWRNKREHIVLYDTQGLIVSEIDIKNY